MANHMRGTLLLSFIFMICTTLLFLFLMPKEQPVHKNWQQELSQTLHHSWEFYKRSFMENGERVISNNYGGTITEGQSYALLKAVWMNDSDTFRKAWRWTQQHLQRIPKDHLFAWRWGKKTDGTMGVISKENATDADEDIAYALLLAGEKWHRPGYIEEAKQIIQDLWKTDVRYLHGKYYLTPGDWNGFYQHELTLDPSYFAPYIYRKFSLYDAVNAQGWLALARDIYPTLEACSHLTKNHLPPNWCAVAWEEDKIQFSDVQGPNSRDFSYDAFRVFWRMAIDATQGSREAKKYLERHPYLQFYWNRQKTLPEGFRSTGEVIGPSPSGFTSAVTLAQSHILKPSQDSFYYKALLAPHYHAEGYWFNDYNDYLHSVIWLNLYAVSLNTHSQFLSR